MAGTGGLTLLFLVQEKVLDPDVLHFSPLPRVPKESKLYDHLNVANLFSEKGLT